MAPFCVVRSMYWICQYRTARTGCKSSNTAKPAKTNLYRRQGAGCNLNRVAFFCMNRNKTFTSCSYTKAWKLISSSLRRVAPHTHNGNTNLVWSTRLFHLHNGESREPMLLCLNSQTRGRKNVW